MDESDAERQFLIGRNTDPLSSQNSGLRNRSYVRQPEPEVDYHGHSHVPEALSPDELLYRMNYAFINHGFDAEKEIEGAQSKLSVSDQEAFEEKILDKIQENSLPLREKLKIIRVLQRGSHRRRESRGQYISTGKTRNNLSSVFQLWETPIKDIAAYFGSNVASYFTFLRVLFYINVSTAFVMFAFTTLPHLVDKETESNLTIPGTFGELSGSLMFYGAYSNKTINNYEHPLAYLLTWFAVSVTTLIAIGISMNVRYRRSKLAVTDDNYDFSHRTFCSWDHGLTTRSGTCDHIRAFTMELKEKIREEKSHERKAWTILLARVMGRLASNILVLGMLGGSGYLIYYIAHDFELPEDSPDFLEDIFTRYQLTAVVAALKLIVPAIFQVIGKLEAWHPRIEQKVTLTRTMLFYFASLVIFIYSLYNVTKDCLDNSMALPSDIGENTTVTNRTFCCWENEVGEEVFKLILVDLGVCVAVALFFYVLKAILVKSGHCFDWVKLSKFAVSSNVLELIYGQGLVWLGLYFSPVIAIVGSIKLIIVFYLRYFVARVAIKPPTRVFRASRSGNFYLFLLLLTWFLCILPQAYVIIELTPSWDCGPFRREEYVYQSITNGIGDLPDWLDDTLSYIGTTAVAVPVIILLILIGLYYKTRASSYSDLARQLRNQLIFERKVEKRKVFAIAMSAPAGSLGRTTGMTAADRMNGIDEEPPVSNIE
ncbi:transmembrane channel-like protein 3 [Mizuhopecten yessoensis]|uniref:Transmembrane channel-like protein 3 n=1 Tax=Mizuhopecten yessoensis TaxID=6573 RepID=A0A210PKX5_MIZYE|nr:transmembrane channel-like protein 3 [Mizuhopecten yessoensis]OWF37139.1 Transmembrane channel-like protein 3 [Mizuhopecten yessoensis]